MDLESLKIFNVMATELSITRTAARLGRVASNITTRIQQLEADVGVELFVRAGKRMTLSTAGEHFLRYSRQLLALEEEARHVVSGGVAGGALRIGCMESTAASRLPEPLAQYHARFPKTRLEVTTNPSRTLIDQVLTGRLDCAFAAVPPAVEHEGSLSESGLSYKSMWTEELVLLLPANESNGNNGNAIKARALAAFPHGCTYRAIAEDYLGIAGNAEWTVLEMNSYHGMIACVAAGSCITLLPRSVLALADIPKNLKTRSIGHVDTRLLWRKGFEEVPAFNNLLMLMSESAS